MNIDWELLSWVLEGPQRTAIMQVIDRPMTPTVIYRETKARYAPKASRDSIYRSLRALINKELIKCKNDHDAPKGSVCDMTNKGMKINSQLFDMLRTPNTVAQVHKRITAQGTEIHFNNVSARIQEMFDICLVECLTPHKKRGKIYKATEEGEKIIKILQFIANLE